MTWPLLVVAIVFFLFGLHVRRIRYEITRTIRMWRMGICFHYSATGRRENRAWTVSDFCRRCGHPAGYHR